MLDRPCSNCKLPQEPTKKHNGSARPGHRTTTERMPESSNKVSVKAVSKGKSTGTTANTGQNQVHESSGEGSDGLNKKQPKGMLLHHFKL